MKAINLKERMCSVGLILALLCTAFSQRSEAMYSVSGSNLNDSVTAQFLREALVCNRMEIQLALMASKRAVHHEVKAYAKNLLQYQKDLNLKLRRLVAEKNLVAKDELDDKCKDAIDKVSRLNGALFERKYLAAAEKNQKEALLIYKQQTGNSTDAKIKAFASATIPFLETHNASIELLSRSIK